MIPSFGWTDTSSDFSITKDGNVWDSPTLKASYRAITNELKITIIADSNTPNREVAAGSDSALMISYIGTNVNIANLMDGYIQTNCLNVSMSGGGKQLVITRTTIMPTLHLVLIKSHNYESTDAAPIDRVFIHIC